MQNCLIIYNFLSTKKTCSHLSNLQNSSNSKLYNLKLNAGFEKLHRKNYKFQMQAINFDVIISAIPLAGERGVCRWTCEIPRERVPYLSALEYVHDKVLYKSTFTFTFNKEKWAQSYFQVTAELSK